MELPAATPTVLKGGSRAAYLGGLELELLCGPSWLEPSQFTSTF
jgi:hypothetical protein